MTFKTPPRPCASPKPNLSGRLLHMDANREIPIVSFALLEREDPAIETLLLTRFRFPGPRL